MKKNRGKNTSKNFTIQLLSLLLLAGWGTKDDNETLIAGAGKKPSVNFYGTVIDNTHAGVQAQYINLGGLYRQVPVYLIPKDLHKKDYNPADNIARIDLAEISQIKISDSEKLYTFSGRTYIEIEIVSNDKKTTNTYMVESSKKIYFDELNESGPIERELMLTAVQEVNIEGYTSPQPDSKLAKNTETAAANCQTNKVSAQIAPSYNKTHNLEDLSREVEYSHSENPTPEDLTNGL